jgi:hypothetical protein
MDSHLLDLVRAIIAVSGGLGIGYGFGLLQAAARSRLERKQAAGRLNSGWSVMPGSMSRVALLLLVLALIQAVCPVFFVDGIQWWVSAGVAVGYGAQLFIQLRIRRAALAEA